MVDTSFKHPMRAWLHGQSGSGKTTLTINLIRHRDVLFNVKFSNVYWIFYENQPAYDDLRSMPNVVMMKGLPENDEIFETDTHHPRLLVIDDAMSSLTKETIARLSKFFQQGM